LRWRRNRQDVRISTAPVGGFVSEIRLAVGDAQPAGENAVKDAQQSMLSQSVLAATGVDVARCYQCGKCTAGCPMAARMDLMPHQVMRLVQLGDEASADKALRCAAIWSCAGCLTCTQRDMCTRSLTLRATIIISVSSSRRNISGISSGRVM
jgi:heterodisulfide reductase subunit C